MDSNQFMIYLLYKFGLTNWIRYFDLSLLPFIFMLIYLLVINYITLHCGIMILQF